MPHSVCPRFPARIPLSPKSACTIACAYLTDTHEVLDDDQITSDVVHEFAAVGCAVVKLSDIDNLIEGSLDRTCLRKELNTQDSVALKRTFSPASLREIVPRASTSAERHFSQ